MRFALFLSMLWLTACPLVEPAPVPPPKETGCLRVHPLAIDFGEVATFTNGFATARVTNESDQTQTLRALPLSPPFVVTPTDQFVVVRSGESATFQVRFEPGDSLLHLDELEVSSPRCSVKVPVQGLGEGVLEVTPLLLDFGMLDLRQSKTLEVQFLNTRRVPDSLVFSPLPGDTFTLSAPTLVVPAVGSASLLVTARPTGPFLYEAALQIESVLGRSEVLLHVIAGHPIAEVTPASLDVPVLGYSADSQPASFVQRTVRIRNAADAGAPDADLQFLPPFFSVEGEDGGASPFEVGNFALTERVMRPGEESLVTFTITPASPGPRRFRVTIRTNDPLQPELVLPIEANAVDVPACTLGVEPTGSLRLTASGGGSSGRVHFTNLGITPCLLDHVVISGAGFSLAAGGAEQVELAPGDVYDVNIVAALPGRGWLTFHPLGPDSVQRFIQIDSPP